jgi:hypothetical protein
MKKFTPYLSAFIALFFFISMFVIFYKKSLFSSYLVRASNLTYLSEQYNTTEGDYQFTFLSEQHKKIYLYGSKSYVKQLEKKKSYDITYRMRSANLPYDYVIESIK